MSSLLPLKQRRFAASYILLDGNGVKAMYAAGYKQGYNSACVEASRLLRKPKVREMIDSFLLKDKMDAEETAKEIAIVARTKVPIDTAAKMKALDLLTKINGMQIQKIESSSTVTTIDPSQLLRSITRLASKTGANPLDIAQEFLADFSDQSDPDYNPDLEAAVTQIIANMPVTEIVNEQISESSLEQ